MTWADVVLAGLVLLVLGVVGVGARRLRWIHGRLVEVERSVAALARPDADIFRQLEALHALYTDLRLETSLPPTRDFAPSPDILRVLAAHALEARPGRIVECGSGVSTVVLARCSQLSRAGHVYSLEHLSEPACRRLDGVFAAG